MNWLIQLVVSLVGKFLELILKTPKEEKKEFKDVKAPSEKKPAPDALGDGTPFSKKDF